MTEYRFRLTRVPPNQTILAIQFIFHVNRRLHYEKLRQYFNLL